MRAHSPSAATQHTGRHVPFVMLALGACSLVGASGQPPTEPILEQPPAAVQPAAQPAATQPAATQPAAQHYWLRVTGERVNLRSRPDINSRIVGRVNTGDVLEAVGSEYNWHRVVPPPGVYSLVAAGYVERVGPDRGVVKVDTTLRVRVGSDVQPADPALSEVQAWLENGAEVQIIGELDADWLKIRPPPGVYVYVSGEYVEKITAEAAAQLRAAPPALTTQPALAAATTQPVAQAEPGGRWSQRLNQVLARIDAEEQKPTERQQWEACLGLLRPIAAQREEPQIAQLAAAWMEELEQRKQAQAGAPEARGGAGRAGTTGAAPEFDAQGVLRPSFAVPAGPYGMRYKLQDVGTHAVRAYVEFPTELKIDVSACLGKYVGVRGEPQQVAGVPVPILRVTEITVLELTQTRAVPARRIP